MESLSLKQTRLLYVDISIVSALYHTSTCSIFSTLVTLLHPNLVVDGRTHWLVVQQQDIKQLVSGRSQSVVDEPVLVSNCFLINRLNKHAKT